MINGSRCKKCSRTGEKLFPKCEKKFSNTKSGGRPRKVSEFGGQLLEKQKARYVYGVNERQMKKYFQAAAKKKSRIEDFLLQTLERRLDNVIYRLGFVSVRSAARQAVRHGHFFVNGKKVSTPSYEIRINDLITLNPKLADSNLYKDLKIAIKNYEPPAWLALDKEKIAGKVIAPVTKNDIITPLNANLIVEYYSH